MKYLYIALLAISLTANYFFGDLLIKKEDVIISLNGQVMKLVVDNHNNMIKCKKNTAKIYKSIDEIHKTNHKNTYKLLVRNREYGIILNRLLEEYNGLYQEYNKCKSMRSQ